WAASSSIAPSIAGDSTARRRSRRRRAFATHSPRCSWPTPGRPRWWTETAISGRSRFPRSAACSAATTRHDPRRTARPLGLGREPYRRDRLPRRRASRAHRHRPRRRAGHRVRRRDDHDDRPGDRDRAHRRGRARLLHPARDAAALQHAAPRGRDRIDRLRDRGRRRARAPAARAHALDTPRVTLLGDVARWFADPANWQGPHGILVRVLENIELSGLAVVVAVAIAMPVALYLGHVGRGGFIAINVANIGRALPSLALLAFGLILA